MGLTNNYSGAPYFDDFDEEKNFHRIMFKPAFAVQARELTQLQTILQNQIERFGDNILREGTIVKGGNFVEDTDIKYVKILDNNTANQSVIVSRYEDLYAVGTVTGLRAIILKTSSGLETQAPNLNTLFVKYLNNNDSNSKIFNLNENLNIVDINDNIIETVTVAGTSDPTPIGDSYGVFCGDGVIFHKGHFIRFENDLTIVSKYNREPTGVVVGFETVEEIVDSNVDQSLLDNSEGYNNFNAPGADRLKLIPVLTVKTLAEAAADDSFFAIQEYYAGNVTRRRLTTQYNVLEKMIEKRDFEYDGNFIAKSFPLVIKESRISTDLLACSIGAGVAYVGGKRVELISNIEIDFEKSTETNTVENQNVITNYGHYISVENYQGFFNINTFESINLLNSSNTTIGTANIRNITRDVGDVYRFYIFNIRMTSGNTFENVRGVENASGASANLILNNVNNAVIAEFSLKSSFFETGKSYIDTFDLDNTSYVYRSSNNNLEATTGGVIDINIPTGSSWSYIVGTNLDEAQKRDLILVANETISPYTTGELIDISGNNAIVTVSSQTQLTVTLSNPPTSVMGVSAYYSANRDVTTVNNKNLETIYIKINTDTNEANTSGVYTLGVPDVLEIDGIWRVNGNTEYSDTAENVTDKFNLFSNQKDAYYGLSYVTAVRGFEIEPEDKFLVKAKVFRKTNSVNNFFTVNSYPVDDVTKPLPVNKIRTEQIPTYTSESNRLINLRDVIDFRTYAANTAAYSTTIEAATENPEDVLSFGASSIFFPAPNKAVTTSYSYYLGRIDLLTIDEDGRFEIIRGLSSENPTIPQEPQKALTVANIFVSPYPSIPIGEASRIDRSIYSVYITRVNNRNYTRSDIRRLDRRIENLENYTALSILEKETTDLVIQDATGLDRFKSGILVDNFKNLSIANVKSSEYAASIDPAYNEIAPKFRSYPLDLKFLSGENTTNYGDAATLLNYDAIVISQPEASNIRSCTTDFWKFNGNMIIEPESDSTTDTIRAPDINFSLDLETPFTEFTEQLSEFVPLQTVSNNVVNRNVTRSTSTRGFLRTTTSTTTTTTENVSRELEIGSTTVEETLGDFVTNVNFNPFLRSRDIQIQVYGLRPNTRFYFFFDEVDVNEHVAAGTLQTINGQNTVIRTSDFSADNEIKSDSNGALFAIFRIPAETFAVGDRTLEIFDLPLYNSLPNATSFASRTYHGFNVSTSNAFLTSTTRLPQPTISTSISRSTTTRTATSTVNLTPPPPPPPAPPPPTIAVPTPPAPLPPPTPPAVPVVRPAVPVPPFDRAAFMEANRLANLVFDPIAQTFIIDPEESFDNSVFITKVDIFFARKSETNGCIVEIREVVNGYPSGVRVPLSRVHLTPEQISANISSAIEATTVTFPAPISLRTGLEYALVIQPDANDPDYQVWISKVGETDVDSGRAITMDSNLGVIFTSTNNKTWTPYQDENLKFNLYRGVFYTETGNVSLTNRDNEFLNLVLPSNVDFREGESVYVSSNTFASGTISVNTGNTTIIGSGTLFSSEYETGEHIVLDDGAGIVQVARIASIANNTVMTLSDVPFNTFSANHYKSVTGKVSYYNKTDPVKLILDDSSAKDGQIFTADQEVVGADSGASGTISAVTNLPITYMQPNIFRINSQKTRTALIATRLYDGNTYYSKNLEFNDNNYLNTKTTYIKSRSNEISQDLGEKSFTLKVDMGTGTNHVSPFIDHKISNVMVYEHFINNDSTGERSVNGDALSKYVSRKVELADGLDAEDIRVFLTAYRPPNTDIEVWVKFQSASDSNVFEDCRCVAWTKLRKKDELDVFSSDANRFDYKQIEYDLSDQVQEQGGGAWLQNGDTFTYIDPAGAVYNNYKYFAVKIVFLSESHAAIPRVKDMRAIAVT